MGSANRTTLASKGNSPIAKRMGSGNMKIRWYQHRVQGGSSMTSLKKRLPRLAALTRSQQAKRSAQFVSTLSVASAMALRSTGLSASQPAARAKFRSKELLSRSGLLSGANDDRTGVRKELSHEERWPCQRVQRARRRVSAFYIHESRTSA